jgi:hypothetical protein
MVIRAGSRDVGAVPRTTMRTTWRGASSEPMNRSVDSTATISML